MQNCSGCTKQVGTNSSAGGLNSANALMRGYNSSAKQFQTSGVGLFWTVVIVGVVAVGIASASNKGGKISF